MSRQAPRLEVVSGPSGAGKSTFAAAQRDWTHVVNIDALEAQMGSREAAAEQMHEAVCEHVDARRSFVIDHVVDSEAIRRWVEPAVRAGYQAWGWLLGTDAAETVMTRVRQRKIEGGHGTDDEGVRALHGDALGGFGTLTLLCHRSVLIDTSRTRARIAAVIEGFEFTPDHDEMPEWAQELTAGLMHSGRLGSWGRETARRVTGAGREQG